MATENRQIFIIDDDESVCRALKCLLMTFGFAVRTFLSGAEYFGAVPNTQAGCLILDIHMPVMDGWEVLRQITKSGDKRPVIIISADKKEGLSERALKSGAAGFFQKPVNDQDLVDLINKTYKKEESSS